MKRRKRSDMTEADCLEAMREFSGRVNRFMETSSPRPFEFECAPDGTIVVAFQVRGGFGVADPIFEAIRVLGGHKLPAKEKAS